MAMSMIALVVCGIIRQSCMSGVMNLIDESELQMLAELANSFFKVAASRAMQQNAKLKVEVEELQKELVHLINTKAGLIDQLEDQKRRIENMAGADGEIKGLQAALRWITIGLFFNNWKCSSI